MRINPVLAALLIVSVCLNLFFAVWILPTELSRLSQLDLQLGSLSSENARLQSEVAGANAAGYPPGGSLTASLQAPAVAQSVQTMNRGMYVIYTVAEQGSIMNVSAEIKPGRGRTLVQTTPLMGVVFQDAANTAVDVAANRTGYDLSKSDVIFSISAGNQFGEVDGPSAGALMTLLAISAIERRPVNSSVTVTGTIDENGHVGAVGGIVAKAAAARDAGKTLFIIPAENKLITPPATSPAGFNGFAGASALQVSAKDYVEKNIGIRVLYVNSIDEAVALALGP